VEAKFGNYFKRTFGPFYDETGALYAFPITTDIDFFIKTNKSDADADALAHANFASGVTLSAASGTFVVAIASSAMEIPAGDYYMGAQETRSDGNVYELDLTEDRKSVETITITADGWRG
jgi:hypothetical protein